jgi:hypothetical protein
MKDRLQERYEHDPAFYAMVNHCEALISRLQLTPSELREAVMFAVLRYDMHNPQSSLTMARKPDGTLSIEDLGSWIAR